jgi:hypothetical protein
MQLYTDIDMKLMEAERARLGGGHGYPSPRNYPETLSPHLLEIQALVRYKTSDIQGGSLYIKCILCLFFSTKC